MFSRRGLFQFRASLHRSFGALLGDPAGAIAFVDVACVPGTEAAFEQHSTANAAASVLEPLNARFDCLRVVDNPSRYVLVEAYTDAAGAVGEFDHRAPLVGGGGCRSLAIAFPRSLAIAFPVTLPVTGV